ncbi:hypothetical protein Tsubulata_007644, partial [Turnera subulata]
MARKRKAPVEVPVPASPSEEEETASGSEEEEVGEGNQSENESGFEAASKESKRSKKEVAQPDNEHADDESRTNLNQRIWSDADEIILLQGVISFNKEKGISYRKLAKNMDLFYNFIKGSLHFDVSITQVKDKLSRLRKKYRKSRGKTSQKPHESQLYDLCKKIWENIADDGACRSNRNVGQSRSKKGKANAKKLDYQYLFLQLGRHLMQQQQGESHSLLEYKWNGTSRHRSSSAWKRTIPYGIFNTPSLIAIGFIYNNIYGNLSKNICDNLPNLRQHSFGDMEMVLYLKQLGTYPCLGFCFLHFSAAFLKLFSCFSIFQFTGHTPQSIFNMTSIQKIDFSNNNLS